MEEEERRTGEVRGGERGGWVGMGGKKTEMKEGRIRRGRVNETAEVEARTWRLYVYHSLVIQA